MKWGHACWWESLQGEGLPRSSPKRQPLRCQQYAQPSLAQPKPGQALMQAEYGGWGGWFGGSGAASNLGLLPQHREGKQTEEAREQRG